jgi:hypothetical protein
MHGVVTMYNEEWPSEDGEFSDGSVTGLLDRRFLYKGKNE